MTDNPWTRKSENSILPQMQLPKLLPGSVPPTQGKPKGLSPSELTQDPWGLDPGSLGMGDSTDTQVPDVKQCHACQHVTEV